MPTKVVPDNFKAEIAEIALADHQRTLEQNALRIRTLYEAAHTFAAALEAQLMEAVWQIREVLPEPVEFKEFIKGHTPMDPKKAILMADTWAVARDNRQVRELALSKPNEALRFVREFVAVGAQDSLDGLNEEDAEVTRLLTLSPRKRLKAIRELITTKAGHHPADAEQIHSLKQERDAAVAAMEKVQVAEAGPRSFAAELLVMAERITVIANTVRRELLYDDTKDLVLAEDEQHYTLTGEVSPDEGQAFDALHYALAQTSEQLTELESLTAAVLTPVDRG